MRDNSHCIDEDREFIEIYSKISLYASKKYCESSIFTLVNSTDYIKGVFDIVKRHYDCFTSVSYNDIEKRDKTKKNLEEHLEWHIDKYLLKNWLMEKCQ